MESVSIKKAIKGDCCQKNPHKYLHQENEMHGKTIHMQIIHDSINSSYLNGLCLYLNGNLSVGYYFAT